MYVHKLQTVHKYLHKGWKGVYPLVPELGAIRQQLVSRHQLQLSHVGWEFITLVLSSPETIAKNTEVPNFTSVALIWVQADRFQHWCCCLTGRKEGADFSIIWFQKPSNVEVGTCCTYSPR